MKIYELYDHQDMLKARVTVDDSGHPAWDFSMDEWGAVAERRRSSGHCQAIEFFERHNPREPGFRTEGVIVRRVHS